MSRPRQDQVRRPTQQEHAKLPAAFWNKVDFDSSPT